MERIIPIRNHSLKYMFLLILLFSTLILNAQDKIKNRNYDSIYISHGIKQIAEQVDKNGWINFKPESDISATDFFNEHKQNFGLGEKDDMILKKIISDDLGYSHYIYYQKYNGIKVEFSKIVLHEENGSLIKSSGNVIPLLVIDTKPTLSERQAIQYVDDYLIAKLSEKKAQVPELLKIMDTELVILPKDSLLGIDKDYLTYKFNVYIEQPIYGAFLYVDANSGKILLEDLNILNTDATGSAVTLYSGTRAITTDYTGSLYRLRDYSLGADIITLNMNNGSIFSNAVDFTDADNNWTPANAGYDAHWGIEQTYKYYESYGRNSFDNAGATINSYVHTNLIGLGYPDNINAFWDGTNLRMVFGDGGAGFTPLTCIDVAAHEFTHAITDFTSNLVYSYESGALNESFSDIFGTAIEFYAKPEDANWLLGDEISTTGDPLRNMENPNAEDDPDTYGGTDWQTGSADYGGVHTNCGVQNFWFYLLAEGGSGTNDNGVGYNVTGIGIESAAAIAYRNLTVYLTDNSNYQDARQGSIEAASDLFGKCSNELTQVINAWDAVGVAGTSSISTNITACGSIADETIYIATNNIYAGNYCSGGITTISSGRTVIFRAGNNIILDPGFQAQPGSTFKANVINCGGGVIKSTNQSQQVNYSETIIEEDFKQQSFDLSSNSKYSIYPNPTSGKLTIRSELLNNNPIQITIFNISGSVIYNKSFNTIEAIIDLSGNPAGVYILKISDGTEVIIQKLIRE
jgi:bacillolysin